jgi:glycosyltransferase involved in cell wall biosynthesis
MKLSLMIHTASPDDFLLSQGIPSYFAALLSNLCHQTFRDFELVYVDTYHEENRERFRAITRQHPVKHVPVHPEHRYWFDRGNCFIAAAKNTGILYADGELCVSCDDAEFFPEQFLQRYWDHYKQGRYMHALHKRLRTIATHAGEPDIPIQGDLYVNDNRWGRLDGGKTTQHRFGSLCFAGTSFSLGDALTLNGYNERMDGCKSLDDCDFGNRLRGLGRSFAMDPDGYLFILEHGSYADNADCNWPDDEAPGESAQEQVRPPVKRKEITNFIAVENHGMLRCGTELVDLVANKNPLTPQHWAIIQADTIKYRKFDPLAPEHAENLAIWKGTPTFNLKKQREALRRSPAWEW